MHLGRAQAGAEMAPADPAARLMAAAPLVTSTSPMKTLYVMSDAKLSALTKSAMAEAPSVPFKLPGLQPSSSSCSFSPTTGSPPCTVAFTPGPPGVLGHPKVPPLLQVASKTLILTSPPKGDGPVGDKVGLGKGALETLARVPSVLDDGSPVLPPREPGRPLLPAGTRATLVTLGSGLASVLTSVPALAHKP